MALEFKFARGDVTLHSTYSGPAFDLFQNPSLLNLIHAELSKYGVLVGSMRLETTGTLGEVGLQAYLPDFTGLVRIHFDRTEIQSFNWTRVGPRAVAGIATDLFRVIGGAKPALTFKTHTLTVNIHGWLSGSSASQFVSRFVTVWPQGLNNEVGRGVVFYSGPEGPQVMSSVLLDLSTLVADALFVRVLTTWDGERLELSQIPTLVERHPEEVLRNVGLSLKVE